MPKTAKLQQQADAKQLASKVIAERLTIGQAAAELGWSESKAYKLSCSLTYRRIYASHIAELADANLQQIIDAEGKAIQTIVDAMDDPRPHIALDAAKAILAQHGRSIASVDRQLAKIRDAEYREENAAEISLVDIICGISRTPSNTN